MWAAFDAIERQAAAAKTLLAARVDESRAWARAGDRSVEEHLARKAGSSQGAARRSLACSKRLQAMPATEAALRRGELSQAQAETITDAAAVNPGAERSLLETARSESLGAPARAGEPGQGRRRPRSRRDPPPAARPAKVAALHRQRRGVEPAGAGHRRRRGGVQHGARRPDRRDLPRCAPTEAAPSLGTPMPSTPLSRSLVGAWLCRSRRRHAPAAPRRRWGRSKPLPARLRRLRVSTERAGLADAVGSAPEVQRQSSPGRGGAVSPRFLALLRVDLQALVRGRVDGDELCEIAGVGSVPAGVARELLGDAVLKLVITRGVDVLNVTHLGRGPTAAQRIALCGAVPGAPTRAAATRLRSSTTTARHGCRSTRPPSTTSIASVRPAIAARPTTGGHSSAAPAGGPSSLPTIPDIPGRQRTNPHRTRAPARHRLSTGRLRAPPTAPHRRCSASTQPDQHRPRGAVGGRAGGCRRRSISVRC